MSCSQVAPSHQSVVLMVHELWESVFFEWATTEKSFAYFLLNSDTYSELTGPDNISVTSDSLLVLVVYSTNHKGWMLCAEVFSAVDDPHVSTVTRQPFDLWHTGRLTFVQVLLASIELSKVWSLVTSGRTEGYASTP